MGIFGWSYPPGAEHDPNAPYNQEDLPEECPVCKKPNADADGNWIHRDGPFCSRECEEKHDEEMREYALAETLAYEESRESDAFFEQFQKRRG